MSKSEWFGDVFKEGEAVLVGDFVEGLGVADGEHDVASDDEAESKGESGVGVLRVAFEVGGEVTAATDTRLTAGTTQRCGGRHDQCPCHRARS